MVRWVENAPSKMVYSRSSHTDDLKNGTCSLSSLVLDVNGWVQGNCSRAELPLTLRQCSISCETDATLALDKTSTKVAPWSRVYASGDGHR